MLKVCSSSRDCQKDCILSGLIIRSPYDKGAAERCSGTAQHCPLLGNKIAKPSIALGRCFSRIFLWATVRALRHSPTPCTLVMIPPPCFSWASPKLLDQFDWWLLLGGDGHHSAGAGATAATMPGRTLHQGAGMEEEGVVDQQQAECDQVRCSVLRWTRRTPLSSPSSSPVPDIYSYVIVLHLCFLFRDIRVQTALFLHVDRVFWLRQNLRLIFYISLIFFFLSLSRSKMGRRQSQRKPAQPQCALPRQDNKNEKVGHRRDDWQEIK